MVEKDFIHEVQAMVTPCSQLSISTQDSLDSLISSHPPTSVHRKKEVYCTTVHSACTTASRVNRERTGEENCGSRCAFTGWTVRVRPLLKILRVHPGFS